MHVIDLILNDLSDDFVIICNQNVITGSSCETTVTFAIFLQLLHRTKFHGSFYFLEICYIQYHKTSQKFGVKIFIYQNF